IRPHARCCSVQSVFALGREYSASSSFAWLRISVAAGCYYGGAGSIARSAIAFPSPRLAVRPRRVGAISCDRSGPPGREGDVMMVVATLVIIAVVVCAVVALASVRVMKQYERAVKFRLGRVGEGALGPGLIVIVPIVNRIH